MYVSREINVGGILMGGRNPVRIQSMCNTPTSDVETSAGQCIRLFKAGASLVRLSVRNKKEAEALGEIRENLSKQGVDLPLVADVHFSPLTARLAATLVSKVRINPGNFIRSQQGNSTASSPGSSTTGDIRPELVPLLDVCRKHRTCLRIGVNHGSLSERIMNDYGDSPEGMVASALEYLEVCEEEGFRDVVLSLKSSNTYLMIRANRLLVAALNRRGMDPPIHLGVTEAGDATEGRIKSAIGIGTLLSEGIGNTIRVSLTGDPLTELPVARKIIEAAQRHHTRSAHDSPEIQPHKKQSPREAPRTHPATNAADSPDGFQSADFPEQPGPVLNIGGKNVPVVISSQDPALDGPAASESKPDYIFIRKFDPKAIPGKNVRESIPGAGQPAGSPKNDIPFLLPGIEWNRNIDLFPHAYPVYEPIALRKQPDRSPALNFLLIKVSGLADENVKKTIQAALHSDNTVIVLETGGDNPPGRIRKYLASLYAAGIHLPVVLKLNAAESAYEEFIIQAAVDAGGLLSDRLCQGLWIENRKFDEATRRRLCFDILQACGRRISRTQYIACPSCGRTRFDIAAVLAGIKKKTAHLKNLKIAVMGCIVNGPGEMADADYGYVGSGRDRVTLFRGKEPVRKHILQKDAVAELIALIKNDGRWTESGQSPESNHI